LSACHKTDSNCFLGQEISADGGIHATRGHNKDISVLQNTNESCIVPFRTHGMECWHTVLLYDNAHQHMSTAACTQELWSISTGSCLTILLRALISLRATTTCLPPRRTGLNHRYSTLMSSWGHRQQITLTLAYKNLFPDTSVSIPAVTILRSSLSIYFLCAIIFLHCLFF
jgi:hypothetical protein